MPTSGIVPFVKTWREFGEYFNQMQSLGIIETMKDFYWDVRPKPEFGTVEIRICDCPLTINKAILIAAYMQVLARYLLEEEKVELPQNYYHVYNTNRFQAANPAAFSEADGYGRQGFKEPNP